MPNYNLSWLNSDPTRKKGKDEGGWSATIEVFFGLDKDQQEELLETYAEDEILAPYAEAIKEWKSELDQNNMITSQEWINKTYPNKEEVKVIGNEPKMNGNLTIVDFPNLKKIILQGAYSPIISKCEIRNCPKLKEISIVNCQMKEFVTDDLPNLTLLDLYCNNLTSLDISKYPKLVSMGYASNDNLIPPLQTLTQKIQVKEKELSSVREREQQEKITHLEQELHQLKELKNRLETQAQQKEQELTTELNQLKREKAELETNLQEQETTLNNLRYQLDQLKSELTKKEQQRQDLMDKLNTTQTKSIDLEQQLTNLVVSSGLLTQQVEDLTQQLTEAEQKEAQIRLEKEIQSNLIREQGDKINQQTTQLHSYQQLLKTSEENLKKCQDLINQKTAQLTNLEQEKNNIQTELDQSQEKIKSLESSLLTANTKISQLEARIKELEGKQGNSSELERLKQELTQTQSKSQQEINRLKQALSQTKLKEEQLSQKIKELSKNQSKFKKLLRILFERLLKHLFFTSRELF